MYDRSLDLFYSYAHEDQPLQEEIKKYLRMLEREGLIRGWDDRMIGAGAEWEGQILEALEQADVVLLLISADFLSSDYCWDVEMDADHLASAHVTSLVQTQKLYGFRTGTRSYHGQCPIEA